VTILKANYLVPVIFYL